MFDYISNKAQGALSAANDALSIFKPTPTNDFKQPQYQGQGMLDLGIQSTIPSTIARPSLPMTELAEQERLKKMAPGVALSSDQAILNQPLSDAAQKSSGIDMDYLGRALSNMGQGMKKPQQAQMQMTRTGGGFRMPQNLSSSPMDALQQHYLSQVASPSGKAWNQMIKMPN